MTLDDFDKAVAEVQPSDQDAEGLAGGSSSGEVVIKAPPPPKGEPCATCGHIEAEGEAKESASALLGAHYSVDAEESRRAEERSLAELEALRSQREALTAPQGARTVAWLEAHVDELHAMIQGMETVNATMAKQKGDRIAVLEAETAKAKLLLIELELEIDQSRAKYSHTVNQIKQKLSLAEGDLAPLREAARLKAKFEGRAAQADHMEEDARDLKKTIQVLRQELQDAENKYDVLSVEMDEAHGRSSKLSDRLSSLMTELDAAERYGESLTKQLEGAQAHQAAMAKGEVSDLVFQQLGLLTSSNQAFDEEVAKLSLMLRTANLKVAKQQTMLQDAEDAAGLRREVKTRA